MRTLLLAAALAIVPSSVNGFLLPPAATPSSRHALALGGPSTSYSVQQQGVRLRVHVCMYL